VPLRIPPGDAKTDARRNLNTVVIPGLTRNPESFSPARSAAFYGLMNELDSGLSQQ
jgi:hypothetical protein